MNPKLFALTAAAIVLVATGQFALAQQVTVPRITPRQSLCVGPLETYAFGQFGTLNLKMVDGTEYEIALQQHNGVHVNAIGVQALRAQVEQILIVARDQDAPVNLQFFEGEFRPGMTMRTYDGIGDSRQCP